MPSNSLTALVLFALAGTVMETGGYVQTLNGIEYRLYAAVEYWTPAAEDDPGPPSRGTPKLVVYERRKHEDAARRWAFELASTNDYAEVVAVDIGKGAKRFSSPTARLRDARKVAGMPDTSIVIGFCLAEDTALEAGAQRVCP